MKKLNVMSSIVISLSVSSCFAAPLVYGGYGSATIHNDTNQTFIIDSFDWSCANYSGNNDLTGKFKYKNVYNQKVSEVRLNPHSHYTLPNLLMSTKKDCDGVSPQMHVHVTLDADGKPLIGSIEWYKHIDAENPPKHDLHWGRPVVENCGMHYFSFFPKSFKDVKDLYITNTYMPEGATGKLHTKQCDGYRVPR